jgi:hypothetical protein
MRKTGLRRSGGVRMGVVMSCFIFAAFCSYFVEATIIGFIAQGHSTAYAEATMDPAASSKAFLQVVKVFSSPRCVNCHPAGDRPLQGDEGRPHAMNVKRGPDGKGTIGMRCDGCHQKANQPGPNMPPGGPDWQLPPESMPMVFQNKTPHALCLQFKDRSQNGNRTPGEVVEHLRTAPLVLWGWAPGESRTPVPMAHDAFVKNMAEWAEKGAACPE